MNSISGILNDLDDLQYQVQCTINALDAIHVAMFCGEYTADTYSDGLFGVVTQLNALNQKVKDKLAEVRKTQKMSA